jgi:hypothetical protein
VNDAAGIDVALFDALLAFVSNTYCIDWERGRLLGHDHRWP